MVNSISNSAATSHGAALVGMRERYGIAPSAAPNQGSGLPFAGAHTQSLVAVRKDDAWVPPRGRQL